MVDIIDNEIVGTPELVRNVEKTLFAVSSIPYNNATSVYETAGLRPDPRMGGSCLFKLTKMQEYLPTGTSIQVITSQVERTTHFAMLIKLNGNDCYVDPFLWQRQVMFINGPHTTNTADTLENMWTLNREPDEAGSKFVVSFREKDKPLVVHKFNDVLENIPSSSAIPLRPDLPSYMMQIADPENQLFYRIWYGKNEKNLNDIWVQNGVSGEKTRHRRNGQQEPQRKKAINNIENILHTSEDELVTYFTKAHELEVKLSQSLSQAGIETPIT
jgi:hypothetical protein